jgi:hypothetical protein
VSARPGGDALAQRRVRRWAAVVLLACGGVLSVAAWLRPDPRGFGTHQQLGSGRFASGPCGMLLVTGFPCPTCGMTTAFSHTVRGQFVRAFLVQPAGFVLALATGCIAIGSAAALVRGRTPRLPLDRIASHRLFIVLLGVLLFGWAFKIIAGLVTHQFPLHA